MFAVVPVQVVVPVYEALPVCLEIYSQDQKVEILFEHEDIRFSSPVSYTSQYAVLLRNGGDGPLDVLSMLYPRRLFSDLEGGKVRLRGVSEITEELLPANASLNEDGEVVVAAEGESDEPVDRVFFSDTRQLKWLVTNPNSPDKEIPGLTGKFGVEKVNLQSGGTRLCSGVLELPKAFSDRHVITLNMHKYSAWLFRLNKPLPAGEAQWFAWEINVESTGRPLFDTLSGPVVFHQFVSPSYVHRTLQECFSAAIEDCDVYSDEIQDIETYRSLLEMFDLNSERRVDSHYFELTIEPGPPNSRFVQSWNVEGDLRMLSPSPRVRTSSDSIEEPVYEWKSGSMLEPKHEWTDHGFVLRLTLQTTKDAMKAIS